MRKLWSFILLSLAVFAFSPAQAASSVDAYTEVIGSSDVSIDYNKISKQLAAVSCACIRAKMRGCRGAASSGRIA